MLFRSAQPVRVNGVYRFVQLVWTYAAPDPVLFEIWEQSGKGEWLFRQHALQQPGPVQRATLYNSQGGTFRVRAVRFSDGALSDFSPDASCNPGR